MDIDYLLPCQQRILCPSSRWPLRLALWCPEGNLGWRKRVTHHHHAVAFAANPSGASRREFRMEGKQDTGPREVILGCSDHLDFLAKAPKYPGSCLTSLEQSLGAVRVHIWTSVLSNPTEFSTRRLCGVVSCLFFSSWQSWWPTKGPREDISTLPERYRSCGTSRSLSCPSASSESTWLRNSLSWTLDLPLLAIGPNDAYSVLVSSSLEE